MLLAVLNGSPRGNTSNSRILAEYFLAGFNETGGHSHTLQYLKQTDRTGAHKAACAEADAVLVIFPLYTDAMPGIVKHFIDSLRSDNVLKGKKVAFIVQSGFPEAVHSIYIEKYLEKLCRRLACTCAGTVIKGGVEGLQLMPPWMTKKLLGAMTALGRGFGADGTLDKTIIARLRKPMRMSPARLAVVHVMKWTGVINFYWKSQLKKHKAFDKRFDAPYMPVDKTETV